MKKIQLYELAWPGGCMLGNIIKQARIKAGLTQKQLGLAVGFSEAAAERMVQHWEHDRRDPPLELIRPLAKALGIPIENLIP
jgi:transcriptional regulator with XRE-family HTH domain